MELFFGAVIHIPKSRRKKLVSVHTLKSARFPNRTVFPTSPPSCMFPGFSIERAAPARSASDPVNLKLPPAQNRYPLKIPLGLYLIVRTKTNAHALLGKYPTPQKFHRNVPVEL